MTAVDEILILVAGLLTLVVAAVLTPGIARVFLIAQAAYWSLSYVFRPIVLLATLPEPQFADSIADPRLYLIGYDRGIQEVLKPVLFGVWLYALLAIAYALWKRSHPESKGPKAPLDPNFFPTLYVVYTLGLLGRAASYATGSTGSAGDTTSANPLLDFVTTMATVAAVGLIIFARPAHARTTLLLLAGLTAMEGVWTVIVESKTPILGAALAIAVRFAMTGWTRARIIGISTISIVAVGAFGLLQSIKTTPETKAISLLADSSYPTWVQPFLSILRRFDLLEAATDAYYMDGRTWLTPTQVVYNALLNFVPSQLLPLQKLQSGTAWASQVRGSSVDMTNVNVSLAEGNVSEGMVFGGYTGVVVTMTFTFVLLLVTVRWLHARHIVFVVLGLTLVEYPVLFERGILGSTELIGKSLQAGILIWIIYLLVGEYRRRRNSVLENKRFKRESIPLSRRTPELAKD